MDPRAFVKISVGALGVRVAVASKPARTTGIHSSTSPFFCEIRLPGYPTHVAPVPLIGPSSPAPPDRGVAANFYVDESGLDKLLNPSKSCLTINFKTPSHPCLEVLVYTGRQKEGRLIGTFSLPVDAQWLEGKPFQVHSGWSGIGKGSGSTKGSAELHLNVRVEADPRYMFQFDGETVTSPQIVQIQGNITQPLFSCKFSRDRLSRSRLGLCETPRCGKWSGPLVGCRDNKERKERKGWLIMIHDLSGSPVAAASMVTPFVPSAGSDRVSRSNPGAWLILRPDGGDSWEPWGRLEAWRERGGRGGVGLRFQLGNGVVVSETVISSRAGGEFDIDTMRLMRPATGVSPVESPRSSGDCNFNLGLPVSAGFVMSCSVRGADGGSGGGKPLVQLAMRHITCAEDAAVFMALAAAVDLSIDACQPFSRKLRKELS